jgi:hypothetical protein
MLFVSVGISVMYGLSAGEGGLCGLGDGRVGSSRVESGPIGMVAGVGIADVLTVEIGLGRLGDCRVGSNRVESCPIE